MDTVKKSAVFEKEKVVDVAQKSTSIESEDNPSMRVPWMNNAIHHYHKGTLDHVLDRKSVV